MFKTNKNIIITFFTIMAVFLAKPTISAQKVYLNEPTQEITVSSNVLKAGVSEFKELPKSFYGTWQVSSVLLESSRQASFKKHGSDMWALEKIGNTITLTNPLNGATASITVDEVKGNTAIFSRGQYSNGDKQTEKVIMTIDGDSFEGTDTMTIERRKFTREYTKETATYRIFGNKISGSSVRDILGK